MQDDDGAGDLRDFYPRPPRGGRLLQAVLVHNVKDISIHALREEGDDATIKVSPRSRQFLSTPSARRATTGALIWHKSPCDFYPRPPRGGRPAKRIEF